MALSRPEIFPIWAMLRASNGSGSGPITPQIWPRLTRPACKRLIREELPEVIFSFHPACQLLRSAHPAYSIWAAHQSDDVAAAMAEVENRPEDILTTTTAF